MGTVLYVVACDRNRRETPSYGYRAVHVIVFPDGIPVEIQIRTGGDVVRIEAFDTRPAALEARFEAESEFRGNGDIEVVVLGANSPDALRKTHSRYFKGLSQLVRAVRPASA